MRHGRGDSGRGGSIDGYTVGDGGVGPIVSDLERLYHDIVRGRNDKFMEMSTGVY